MRLLLRFLCVKTVSTHRTHIPEKMKLKNKAELIFYVILNGLIGLRLPDTNLQPSFWPREFS